MTGLGCPLYRISLSYQMYAPAAFNPSTDTWQTSSFVWQWLTNAPLAAPGD
jgi:hypothetical protein